MDVATRSRQITTQVRPFPCQRSIDGVVDVASPRGGLSLLRSFAGDHDETGKGSEIGWPYGRRYIRPIGYRLALLWLWKIFPSFHNEVLISGARRGAYPCGDMGLTNYRLNVNPNLGLASR